MSVVRWKHDFRYQKTKTEEVSSNLFKSTDESVTDQDAGRVSLASNSGDIASLQGSSGRVGSYSLKPGEEYNPSTDFSFLYRKDLTVVDIDNIINDFKKRLESSDASLRSVIEKELETLERLKSEDVKDVSESDSNKGSPTS